LHRTCRHSFSNRIIPQQLVASLSQTDYNVNLGVLETAHSIFRPWRSQVRSDDLFSTINLVLSRFCAPFLALFRQTAQLLLDPGANLAPDAKMQAAAAMRALVDIFYDLTCQDLPPDIEDSHLEFWAPDRGTFLAFLGWDPAELRGDVRIQAPVDSTGSPSALAR
jgi:exportin-2 (importin alpha re-exporter)